MKSHQIGSLSYHEIIDMIINNGRMIVYASRLNSPLNFNPFTIKNFEVYQVRVDILLPDGPGFGISWLADDGDDLCISGCSKILKEDVISLLEGNLINFGGLW